MITKDRDTLIRLSADADFISEITTADVEAAAGYAKMKPRSRSEYFLLLASLNLLNAAVKRSEYKHFLHYGLIKGNVSRLVQYLAKHPLSRSSVKMHIDMQKHVAYLLIMGWQFSFHNIKISESVRKYAESADNSPQEWHGIRLQRIAGELFRWALSYSSAMKEAKKKLTQEIVNSLLFRLIRI